ncbi:MAG TPA: MarR family transcriptional regulator [Acidimicrobiales bacterium]|nr:MarR family transcriptional regulator [Acidimicrobiales bacterium]
MIGRTDPPGRLGAALRRAWLGYQHRLDEEMRAAGFPGRRLSDARVLRLVAQSDALTTAARIGRELGITRQAAAKIVASLRDRGYVTATSSASDGREKKVSLTARGREYLSTQQAAARRLELDLRQQLGSDAFAALGALLEALGAGGPGPDQPRLREYLRRRADPKDSTAGRDDG